MLTLILSIISILVSLTALWLTTKRLRLLKILAVLGSETEIIKTNRELICLAFSFPELMDVFDGISIPNKQIQSRYLQMWINQFYLLYKSNDARTISDDFFNSSTIDIYEFFKTEPVKELWIEISDFYDIGFVDYINSLFTKNHNPPHE